MSSHQNSSEVIDHTCDDNRNILLDTEEEVNVTSIHPINATNDISMNDYDNSLHKYYAPFLSSKNHEDVFSGSEYDLAKKRVFPHKQIILDLIFNKSRSLNGSYH